MTLEQFYETIGGDYSEVIGRLMNEHIAKKFVCKFAHDPTYSQLEQAMHLRHSEEAFIAAHTLKGICLNLGFSELGKSVSELTELLRPKDDSIKTSTAIRLFQNIQLDYKNLITMISQLNQ